jgi:hypothetical protein
MMVRLKPQETVNDRADGDLAAFLAFPRPSGPGGRLGVLPCGRERNPRREDQVSSFRAMRLFANNCNWNHLIWIVSVIWIVNAIVEAATEGENRGKMWKDIKMISSIGYEA